MKTASKDDSIPEFPMQADSLYAKFIPSIKRIKENFPNIRKFYTSAVMPMAVMLANYLIMPI
ncbi:MAG: hypothetical protein IPO24_15490 [Bacteroidetes bacterium]|nr:hypothetical protein [Bacteroidota bacterium]